MKCENCGDDHDGSYGTGRYCSKECKYSAIAKHGWKTRRKNGTYVNNLRPDLLRAEYGRWKCSICGKILESRRILQKHRKDEHGCARIIPWNKGLTIATSEKLRALSAKASATYKSHHHHISPSIETREKISRTMSLKMKEQGGFPSVKWYNVANLSNVEYTVRGTWERDVAVWLNTHMVSWERNHILHYVRDGVRHFYNPDFFLNENGKFIEVKGYFSQYDQIKMMNVLYDNPGVEIYFINKPVFERLNDDGFGLSDDIVLTIDKLITNNPSLKDFIRM